MSGFLTILADQLSTGSSERKNEVDESSPFLLPAPSAPGSEKKTQPKTPPPREEDGPSLKARKLDFGKDECPSQKTRSVRQRRQAPLSLFHLLESRSISVGQEIQFLGQSAVVLRDGWLEYGMDTVTLEAFVANVLRKERNMTTERRATLMGMANETYEMITTSKGESLWDISERTCERATTLRVDQDSPFVSPGRRKERNLKAKLSSESSPLSFDIDPDEEDENFTTRTNRSRKYLSSSSSSEPFLEESSSSFDDNANVMTQVEEEEEEEEVIVKQEQKKQASPSKAVVSQRGAPVVIVIDESSEPQPPPATAVAAQEPFENGKRERDSTAVVEKSPSPMKQAKTVKRPVVLCSGLSSRNMAMVVNACQMWDGIRAEEWREDVTHVVIKSEKGICARTLKYCQGVLCGAFIVSIDWILACLKEGKWVNEIPFIVCDDHFGTGKNVVKESINRFKNGIPRLLEGFRVYLHNVSDSTRKELECVCKTGGATLVSSEPTVDDGEDFVVICSKDISEEDSSKIWQRTGRDPIFSTWIFDCISSMEILTTRNNSDYKKTFHADVITRFNLMTQNSPTI